MIEARGRGFDKIKEACAKYDGHLPEYNISASGIMALCKACDKYMELLNGKSHPVHDEQDDEQDIIIQKVAMCHNFCCTTF
ncbi:MAG: hypothetical protein NC413_13170 [Muribaculum sp.]|nr:hypothetical protein [Muribaculum sp.]